MNKFTKRGSEGRRGLSALSSPDEKELSSARVDRKRKSMRGLLSRKGGAVLFALLRHDLGHAMFLTSLIIALLLKNAGSLCRVKHHTWFADIGRFLECFILVLDF